METNGTLFLLKSAFSDPRTGTWSRIPVNYTPGSLDLCFSPSDLIWLYCNRYLSLLKKGNTVDPSTPRAQKRPYLINKVINRQFLCAGKVRESGWSGFKEQVHSSLRWRAGQQGEGEDGHSLHWCIDPDPALWINTCLKSMRI